MHPIPACSLRCPGDLCAPTRALPGIAALGLLLVAGGCGTDADPDTAAPPASFLPANSAAREGCGSSGLVSATVYGALEGDVYWTGDALDCEGMPRPGGAGVRLRFAGVAGATPLAIIIGVHGIGPEETATELPSNVTVIEEGQGRFFSTPDRDSCWTDVDRQTAIDVDSGRYVIDGTLYCISPLAELNGSGSVSIPELRFSGLVDWGPS